MLLALPALALAVFAWMVAYRGNSELMQQLALPVIPALAVLAVLGPDVLRRIGPPLAFFYFAIPIWDHAVPLLQWLTTQVAEAVLGLMNVPTKVEGHHVTIPAGQFSIIEGCSGKRYFIIGLAFACLAGVMQRLSGRRMVYLMLTAAAAALATNWLRVVIVIYAGHISNMQHYLVAVEHKSLGYALFIPMLFAIGFAARRWGAAEGSDQPAPVAGSEPAAHGAVLALSSLLLAAPIALWAAAGGSIEQKPEVRPLPVLTGTWEGPLPASSVWRPEFTSPADERSASYLSGAHRIEVYVNSYGEQTAGHELIFHRNSIAPAAYWNLIRRIRKTPDAPPMLVAATGAGERWVIAQEYVVGGRVTSEPALAQLYYGLSAVWRPKPAGAIAFATRCEPDCDMASRRLAAFWAGNRDALVDLIPTTFQ
jgi:EpsI family protein